MAFSIFDPRTRSSAALAIVALASCGRAAIVHNGDSDPDLDPDPVALTVAIRPAVLRLDPSGTQQFAATVTGAHDTTVTWSIDEGAAGGTITPSGFYTAPATPGTYHVRATSVAAPSYHSGAAVEVTSEPGTEWLHTEGHRILRPDGSPWHGRGANIHETRSCNACAYAPADVAEVKRRLDELLDNWKANFVRLTLESYASAAAGGGPSRTIWRSPLADDAYLDEIVEIVDYIGTRPGVYVLVSLWIDPSFDGNGWPTSTTNATWARLAEALSFRPHVLFGIVNEPQNNYDGALDAQVWQRMNAAVQAIRDLQDAIGAPYNIVTVQGTGGWSRLLHYYVDHPITAGGGRNVAYEVHVYDAATTFASRFEIPSQTLPVIIGEFGPAIINGTTYMTEADCAALMQRAEAAGVPYLAWTFHMRCSPDLLVDNSGGGCGVGMRLQPTSWGTLLKNRLATPW